MGDRTLLTLNVMLCQSVSSSRIATEAIIFIRIASFQFFKELRVENRELRPTDEATKLQERLDLSS